MYILIPYANGRYSVAFSPPESGPYHEVDELPAGDGPIYRNEAEGTFYRGVVAADPEPDLDGALLEPPEAATAEILDALLGVTSDG